ncbi:MAG TPA: PLP-dependent aminotransferase family protein [Candidatus Methylomirabilis sp.]|nr:PLP-dependent aminotransferase family protein [Candidatus Methylomirabilis sp.]
MTFQLASRMQKLRTSDIREILRVTQRPSVISFAGGLPAATTFPVDELKDIALEVLEKEGAQALQYSTSEGHPVLREQIARRMRERQGAVVPADEILVTAGSQQGLDLVAKTFLEPGDEVLCESPTYLGFIQAVQVFEPAFVEVPTDDQGMRVEALEDALARCRRPRLIYVVPDFQNPSGRCWSLERRRGLLEIARRHRIPVVEDAPYAEIRFEGEALPSLKSLDGHGQVIQLGTFSKIFCPGLRLAWISAPGVILQRLVPLKQAADLHSATLNQMLLVAYLARYDINAAIERIRIVYRARRDAMIAALEREMPAGARFTRPRGGLFIWVELPGEASARQLLARCLERDVAFVPGDCFFPTGGHANTLRLNFSNMPEERIAEGIARLGEALRALLAEKTEREPVPAA